ncbi:hypothetical protein MKK65_10630 [Methylobacterium sp. J-001]|uniref:hypothetical protein n=1 Tax=Methylobacterium sp. J-001 TaxID=2836609 RepID=UPI001FBB7E6D|nr:hypothetical protein [Methylobacterium sp. J-001]MCJ2117019.1 hypothetical protein [Methylobacterium sp. J-001]
MASTAFAQAPPTENGIKPDELMVGPLTVPQTVQGITFNIVSTTYIALHTTSEGLTFRARVKADLRDLQSKIGSIIDTIALPTDNCRSFSANNPVVTIWGKELKAEGSTATLWLHGHVDVWDCRENPVPNSKVEWPNDGPFGLPRPKVVTWPGSPIKNKLAQQPFDISEPVQLAKSSDTAIQLRLGDPDVHLGGQFVAITNGILRIAGVDLNSKAKEALQAAIDPAKLQVSVPQEFLQLNPVIEDATFTSDGGVLGVQLILNAKVPAAVVNDRLQALLSSLKPKTQ